MKSCGTSSGATPGEEGKWFAAAKEVGQLEMAGELANQSPCDPKTLTRAARDFVENDHVFALTVGLAARRWLSAGYGYELSAADVWAAYSPHNDRCGAPWAARRGARAYPRVGLNKGFVAHVLSKELGLGGHSHRGTPKERRRKRNQGAHFRKSLLPNRSDSWSPLSVSSADFALPTGFETKPFSSVHNVPIKSFPCPGAFMQRQIEEGEDGFIDFLGNNIHARASHLRGSRGIAYF